MYTNENQRGLRLANGHQNGTWVFRDGRENKDRENNANNTNTNIMEARNPA